MNKKLTRRVSFVVCTLVAVFLSACSEPNQVSIENGQLVTSMSLPEELRGVRALEDATLEIKVDGAVVPTQQDPETLLWTGQVDVNLGQQHFIEVSWADQSIELVQAEEWFSTPTTDPVELVFENAQFDSSSDSDNDGWSNLVELKNGTDPLDSADPAAAPDRVILNVELRKPNELIQQQALADEDLVVRATLNNGPLPLTRREDLNWFGQREVADNLPAFVTVEWCYRLASGTLYRLLRYTESVDMADLLETPKFLPTPREKYRSDYDLDADGISNINEIANGTAPASSGQSSACL